MFGQIGMNSQAASQLSGTFDHSYWFSIPEGGHASCSVEVTYREYYTYNGKRNVFNRRTKTYMMNVAGATTVPYMKMGNSKHLKSDGTTIKTFSTWTMGGACVALYGFIAVSGLQMLKEVDLQNYLFKTDVYELPPQTRLDITNNLRREMIEIFSGRNIY